MVQLVEVEDEHFQQAQAGFEEDEGDFTDTGEWLQAGLYPIYSKKKKVK
jgi:hypothetical protein